MPGWFSQAVCDSVAFLAVTVQFWPSSCSLSTRGGCNDQCNIQLTCLMCLVLGVSLIYQGDELKSQQKLSTVMAVCGWIQIQVWCLFLFSVCSVRSTQVEACFVSFKISFFNCPGFILWAQLCVCSCHVAVALSGRCDSLLTIGSGLLTIHWCRCFISTQGYPPASLGLR